MNLISKLLEFEEGVKRRELRGTLKWMVAGYAIFASLCHTYSARFGAFETMQLRSVHLALLLPLTFLLYPGRKSSPVHRTSFPDIVWALLSLLTTLYIGIWDHERIITRMIYVDALTV